MSVTLQRFERDAITDDLTSTAAAFFTTHYGIWGAIAAEKIGVKEGARVKMSGKKLREQILPPGADNIYVRILIGDKLIGNVFATRWSSNNRNFLWITQLCVHIEHRNQGIATRLLQTLRHEDDYSTGILSSHPFAISAALRVFGSGLENPNVGVTKKQASTVMDTCPVEYVRNAKLDGSLDVAVLCADTGFWVDHEVPLKALDVIEKKNVPWPLGHLPEGHEFLALVVSHERSLGHSFASKFQAGV